MQKYQVTTYDYDKTLHRTVIINSEKFSTKENAIDYAKSIRQTSDSYTIVKGNYGYEEIMKITRDEIRTY